jgi:hypothetical protein
MAKQSAEGKKGKHFRDSMGIQDETRSQKSKCRSKETRVLSSSYSSVRFSRAHARVRNSIFNIACLRGSIKTVAKQQSGTGLTRSPVNFLDVARK